MTPLRKLALLALFQPIRLVLYYNTAQNAGYESGAAAGRISGYVDGHRVGYAVGYQAATLALAMTKVHADA